MSNTEPDATLCRHLRWKGMFVGAERDPEVPNPSDGFCWCVHTQTMLGPDGEVADRDHCRPDRACHERRE